MTSKYLCVNCKHFRGANTCEAFPDGIPEKILIGKNNHDKPVRGDHGIQFEPIDKKESNA